MQILERSVIGLRAVFLRLHHPTLRMTFDLYPMIHVAEPAFYAATRAALASADDIVVEGVRGSRVTGLLTAYRFIPKRRRDLGLVCQSDELPWRGQENKLLRIDMGGREFDAYWKRLPWQARLGAWIVMPLWLLSFLVRGTRETIVAHLGTNDLPDRDDIDVHDVVEEVRELIVRRRDRLAIAAMEQHLAAHGDEMRRVAIVWGAAHMPALLDWLMRVRGYRVAASEFVPAISL